MTTESNTEIRKQKKRETNRRWWAAHPDYLREWRAAHLESVRASGRKSERKRRAADPEAKRERDRKYRAENLEKIRKAEHERSCNRWATRREEMLEAARKRYAANVEKERERSRKRYAENIEKERKRNRERMRKAWADNPEKMREREKRKRSTDPNFRMVGILRARLSGALKGRTAKSMRTLELLGCTVAELRAHLERQFSEGMNWTNYGRTGWHVDHIVPCTAFDLTDLEQQKACFHYSNLQPLWAQENYKKGARRGG